MLLIFGPAETTNYLILGFVVIFGALTAHLASLSLRARNLRSDLALLQSLEKKGKSKWVSKRKKRR